MEAGRRGAVAREQSGFNPKLTLKGTTRPLHIRTREQSRAEQLASRLVRFSRALELHFNLYVLSDSDTIV